MTEPTKPDRGSDAYLHGMMIAFTKALLNNWHKAKRVTDPVFAEHVLQATKDGTAQVEARIDLESEAAVFILHQDGHDDVELFSSVPAPKLPAASKSAP